MNDLLLSSDSLTDLEMVSREAMSLFDSRGFKLRKWLVNSVSKSILTNVPQCDLGSNIRELTLAQILCRIVKLWVWCERPRVMFCV